MTTTTVDPNLFKVPSNPYGTSTAQGTNANGYSDTSVFTTQNAQQQQAATPAPTADTNAKDGKDDGKIGFWEAAGKIVGGAFKSVVNTVVDVVTDPKKLITTVAAVAIGIAFPPAGVAMAVAGGIMGAGKVVGGISNAANAKTDAEAEAAFEDIGAGTLQVGMSVVGAKAGIKAMKGTSGSAMAGLEKGAGIGDKVKAFCKDTITGGRGKLTKGTTAYNEGGYLGTKAFNTVKTNISDKGVIKGLKKTGADALDDVRTKISPEKTALKAQKKDLNDNLAKAQDELDALPEGDPGRTAAQTKVDTAKKAMDDLDETIQNAKTDAKNDLKEAKKEYKTAKENAKKLGDDEAAQATADAAKAKYQNTKNDLNTNTISRTASAANNAAKTAGYGSLATASIAPVASTMDSSATTPVPTTATTTTAQTPTTPVAMPELLTYEIDADKINRDAMNAQLTGQALTNGSYGSMLNYES